MKKLLCLSLVASSLLFADSDIEQLKKQMNEQQLMIQKLLGKIEKLEHANAHKEINTLKREIVSKSNVKQDNSHHAHEVEHQTKSETFSQSSFMPDISLIGDISYVSRNIKDGELPHLEVPGVVHGLMGSHSHDGESHAPYNAKEGFNLNYAELILSKSVDPTFNLDGIFHFSESGVEIEELYFTTTALGHGTRIKGGKFKPAFGYLNEQHHHAWSFSDMPLVYESFLGMHGINEKGLQFQWTLPTSHYFMIGAEVLQGENEQMFGNSSIGDAEDPTAKSENAPSLFISYIKSSFDIEDTTVYAGLSYAQGSSRIDHSEDEEEPHAFAGDSKLYGVDLTIKHYFDSYSYLTWQSEYLYRDMDGIQYNFDNAGDVANSPDLSKKQAGLYTQLIYAPNQTWKMGMRYDSIFKNDVEANGVDMDKPTDMYKYSAMVQYNTSEFAYLRLQYNQNRALYNEDGKRQNINSVILQANFSIGAHGAHSF